MRANFEGTAADCSDKKGGHRISCFQSPRPEVMRFDETVGLGGFETRTVQAAGVVRPACPRCAPPCASSRAPERRAQIALALEVIEHPAEEYARLRFVEKRRGHIRRGDQRQAQRRKQALEDAIVARGSETIVRFFVHNWSSRRSSAGPTRRWRRIHRSAALNATSSRSTGSPEAEGVHLDQQIAGGPAFRDNEPALGERDPGWREAGGDWAGGWNSRGQQRHDRECSHAQITARRVKDYRPQGEGGKDGRSGRQEPTARSCLAGPTHMRRAAP
jgi:hypothetical protein